MPVFMPRMVDWGFRFAAILLYSISSFASGADEPREKPDQPSAVESVEGDGRPADETVPFDSDQWVRSDATVTTYLGRTALAGTAFLKDVEFDNGVIEVDIAVTGAPGYPSIIFRQQSPGNLERFYVRPHKSAMASSDALQYVPAFNGIDGWQLYNGNGFTAKATIPANKWLHIKLEVSGTQAQVYLDDAEKPAMVITALQHGMSKGTIGVSGAKDGSACFSNFRYRLDNTLRFPSPPPTNQPPGVISNWEISEPFKARLVDREHAPDRSKLAELTWKNVQSGPSGLVDISRHFGRSGVEPDCLFARTDIHADKKESRKFFFGYSDEVNIFLNGTPLFYGNSGYRSRDLGFQGIVGFFDAVYLPLRKGDNELLLAVTETFGGWGFMGQDGTAVYMAPSVKSLWQTPPDLRMPESAAFDPIREVIYVSNFDGFNPSYATAGQFISRVSMDGNVEDLKWVTGLRNPTGCAVSGNTLFVVEPTSLVEVDIPGAQIKERHAVRGAMALNDVAIGPDGALYVSDSAKNVVYRFSNGEFEQWLQGPEINRPNGLLVQKGKLLIGNNGDGCLKSADLATRKIETLVNLGTGIIDGIADLPSGDILVSHNEGRLYRIRPSGEAVKLIDTTVRKVHIADLTYIPSRRLIVAPTWMDNRLVTYELGEQTSD